MTQFTIQIDTEYPSLYRAFQDGIPIGTAGTYQEIEDYLDLIENGEE